MDSNEVRASVAMAVYNGEKYIEEQVNTVLKSLNACDELVISCDPSTDRTNDIVNQLAQMDNRVTVINNNSEHGVVPNFCNAISHCRGKYIFLCDQDDIWRQDKVAKVLKCFSDDEAWLVIHDARVVDGKGLDTGKTLFALSKISTNPTRNFYKGTYWGCCMAFRSELTPIILPINSKLRHDLWIGILTGYLKRKIVLIDDTLIDHRIHGDNVTTGHRRPMKEVIADRILLARELSGRLKNKKWQLE